MLEKSQVSERLYAVKLEKSDRKLVLFVTGVPLFRSDNSPKTDPLLCPTWSPILHSSDFLENELFQLCLLTIILTFLKICEICDEKLVGKPRHLTWLPRHPKLKQSHVVNLSCQNSFGINSVDFWNYFFDGEFSWPSD